MKDIWNDSGNRYVVKVCNLNYGSPDYALLVVYVEGMNDTSCGSIEPSSLPSSKLSMTMSPSKSAAPTLSLSQSPSSYPLSKLSSSPSTKSSLSSKPSASSWRFPTYGGEAGISLTTVIMSVRLEESEFVQIGELIPYQGGNGGTKHSFLLGDNEYITEINDRSVGYIDQIQFRTNESPAYGGNGDLRFKKRNLWFNLFSASAVMLYIRSVLPTTLPVIHNK